MHLVKTDLNGTTKFAHSTQPFTWEMHATGTLPARPALLQQKHNIQVLFSYNFLFGLRYIFNYTQKYEATFLIRNNIERE